MMAITHNPAHRTARWLSSQEVEDAIKDVVEQRGDEAKAIGWDMIIAVSRIKGEVVLPEPPSV